MEGHLMRVDKRGEERGGFVCFGMKERGVYIVAVEKI